MRLSKFHDHPASRIVVSKQSPLRHNTAMLSRISVGPRKASQSESNTSATIGTTNRHRFSLTRWKMAEPSNSHPETTKPVRDSSAAHPSAALFPEGSDVGMTNPTARNAPPGRATIFSRTQRLSSLVGQNGTGPVAARSKVCKIASVMTTELVVKPAASAALRKLFFSAAMPEAIDRLAD